MDAELSKLLGEALDGLAVIKSGLTAGVKVTPHLITADQVCDALQISQRTLSHWCLNGCPRTRVGGGWRYNLYDVLIWSEEKR